MMGLGMGFGVLVMLAFWGALILGAVWLVRAVFPTNAGPAGRLGRTDLTPRQALDQRYARGEISREEYEVIKRDLEA